MYCVVPENLYLNSPLPPQRAMEIQRGEGFQKRAISKGVVGGV